MRTLRADRYDTLDGLRGIAAICVMIGHFGQIAGAYWPAHMFLAVDVFFAMSGFVIAHSYGERLRGGMPARRYLRRRLVRLYPMFIAGLLIGAGVLYAGAEGGVFDYRAGDIARGVALNALYIPFLNTARIGLDVGQIFPADPPAWSLFLEILASVAFIFLCRARWRTLLGLAVFCYLALMGSGLYFAHADGWLGFVVSNGFDSGNFLGGLPRVGFGFTLGMLLHGLARDGVGQRAAEAVSRRVPYPSFALYAGLLAVLVFPATLRGLYAMAALAVAVPAIVLAGAGIRPRGGLETRIARFLGWISYPLYCLHVPIFRAIICIHGGVHGSAYPLMGAGVLATFAVAIVAAKGYDEPLRAALSARLPAAPRRLARATD
jgi:peptidoglycan/LPS O-acetylase OafA/YrhL